MLMPEDRYVCVFTLSWFVPSKPVIHGQFFTGFHTRVLKSAVPPCSECLKPECLFLRKWLSEDTPDYGFLWNLCCVLDLTASQVRSSCELNQFSSIQCWAAGRWALQSLLHGVCCSSAWLWVMLCALTDPAGVPHSSDSPAWCCFEFFRLSPIPSQGIF